MSEDNNLMDSDRMENVSEDPNGNGTPKQTWENAENNVTRQEADNTVQEADSAVEQAKSTSPEISEKKKSGKGLAIVLLILVILLALVCVALLINNKMKKEGRVPQDASVFTAVKSFFTGETAIEQTDLIEGKVDGDDSDKNDGNNQSGSEGTNGTDTNQGDGSSTAAKEYNITVKLGQYKGLTAEYSPEEITDDVVDEYMDYFCENMSDRIELTEGVVEDYSEINFSCIGYIDGSETPDDNCTIEEYDITVGAGGFIDGFEESFIDHEVGETYSVDLTFPDPYENDTSLSGKPVRFEITINKLYDYEIPELTDELVAENTDYNTVEEYRNFVAEALKEQAAEEADTYLEEDLMSAFVDNCEFSGEIEQAIADRSVAYLQECDEQLMAYYGMDTVTFYGLYYGIPEDEVMQMLDEESELEVKTTYAVKELAKQENMTVSEEDYEAQYTELAEKSGMTADEVREDLADMKADGTLEEYILELKVRDFIMENAVISGK